MCGWPNDKTRLDSCKEYWSYRDEISFQDGVLYRGTRIIIPTSLRREMLERIHSSHQRVDASLRKARDSVYWPQMVNDIKNITATCDTCLKFQPAQQQETMHSQPIPKYRFEVTSADLFTLDKEDYSIIVDNFSKYWEVTKLSETTSEAVINDLKQQFARHGIPKVLITDNGPQYKCHEFEQFTQDWNFNHETASPHHPKGNAVAEAAVKSAKNIIKKAKDSGRDPWLAILEFRNTPSDDHSGSPVQK